MSTTREYDLVLYGASGYTGKLTAEQITLKLPSDLKWALAGRTASKLEAVAAQCKALNPDRIQPAIETCNLDDHELSELAKKTRLLISTVGPYALHGEHAFKACAENGTHYLDVTGEVPWVAEMIKKYETTAKSNGSIMIPQIGIDSAPADLVTYTLVNKIREELNAPTGEVIVSLHQLSSKPSGGTLNTVFTLLDVFSLKQVGAAHAPFGISPVPGPKTRVSSPLTQKLFGFRDVRDLGLLTTSLGGMADIPIVQRSWGLHGNYGPNFQVTELMKARNYLTAILIHYSIIIGTFFLAIPFFRSFARRFVYQPGDGPSKEESKNDRVEYRGIAKPDVATPNAPRAFTRVSYEGPLYEFTGLSLAQAAISILRDNHKDLTGGIYTPSMLGKQYIDRLDSAGFKFQTKLLEN